MKTWTRNGFEEVTTVYENRGLGVHEAVGSPGLWLVSHIKTGYRVSEHYLDGQSAIDAAVKLTAGLDWDQYSEEGKTPYVQTVKNLTGRLL